MTDTTMAEAKSWVARTEGEASPPLSFAAYREAIFAVGSMPWGHLVSEDVQNLFFQSNETQGRIETVADAHRLLDEKIPFYASMVRRFKPQEESYVRFQAMAEALTLCKTVIDRTVEKEAASPSL